MPDDPAPPRPVDAALRTPDALVVAARADGRVAVRRGCPDGAVDEVRDRAVLVHAGPPPHIAVGVWPGEHDEALAHLGRFRDPRVALLDLDDPDAALAALGYANWLVRSRFCGRCGQPQHIRPDGRTLGCADGHHEFPRLEPAVIMRVTDADDRLLLARQHAWPEGRFSILAGFVDPGETLEEAVRREVAEEVGLPVGDVAYVASQPWPFPASLMLGYQARALDTHIAPEDGEIAEAAWFTRDELHRAMAAGTVGVPPAVSIAHRLIRAWYGDDLTTWTAGR